MDFTKWIAQKSTKYVDELTAAAYQTTEPARLPIFMIFADFSSPERQKKSQALIKNMEEIAKIWEDQFKVFWTTDERQVNQRRTLGVTWEELPAMAFNSLDGRTIPYPRDGASDVASLKSWFKNLTKNSHDPTIVKTGDFQSEKEGVRDKTLTFHYLKDTFVATKVNWVQKFSKRRH